MEFLKLAVLRKFIKTTVENESLVKLYFPIDIDFCTCHATSVIEHEQKNRKFQDLVVSSCHEEIDGQKYNVLKIPSSIRIKSIFDNYQLHELLSDIVAEMLKNQTWLILLKNPVFVVWQDYNTKQGYHVRSSLAYTTIKLYLLAHPETSVILTSHHNKTGLHFRATLDNESKLMRVVPYEWS